MMSKPVAVVLLLASVVIAAFVGGYLYQQFKEPPVGDEGLVLVPNPESPPKGRDDVRPQAPPSRPGLPRGNPNGAKTSPTDPNTTSTPPVGNLPTPPVAGQPTTGGGGTSAPARGPVDLVVPAGTIITLQLVTPLSSETAKVEDRIEAVIGVPIMVDQMLAVPKGTKVLGSVTTALKGGKVKEPAQVAVRFHTLLLGPEPGISLVIDPIVQLGVAPSGRSKATIGGAAAVGVGLGWLLGGTEGAIKGGITGVGGGTAATMMTAAQPAVVPAGSPAAVALGAPITVRVERE